MVINTKVYVTSLCGDKFKEDMLRVYVVVNIKGYVMSLFGDKHEGMRYEFIL